ncbi:unnamed protein product [Gordionus sp. m RMFG-2023]
MILRVANIWINLIRSFHILNLVLHASVTLFYGSNLSNASHFRGGFITWSPAGKNTVQFQYRLSWRRSFSEATHCDNDIIQRGSFISGNMGNLRCHSGCNGTISDLKIKCTDYSYLSDWVSGTHSELYTFPEDTQNFSAIYQECCWLPIKKGKEEWSLIVGGNLTPRQDTGQVNHAPNSGTPPIVRFQMGCNHTYKIPTSDSDGDIVKCRFGLTKEECGDVCTYFQDIGGRLDPLTCTLAFEANSFLLNTFHGNIPFLLPTFIPVTIILEDFSRVLRPDVPLSRVTLQFMAELVELSVGCNHQLPDFVTPPTPYENSCIAVPIGTTYSGVIEIDSQNPSQRQRSQQRCVTLYGGSSCTESRVEPQNLGDVSIGCYKDGMDIKLKEPSNFTGMMYAKEHYSNPSCKNLVRHDSTRPAILYLSYDKCKYEIDPVLNSLYYLIIIQPHPTLITNEAHIYKAICINKAYKVDNVLTSHVNVKMISSKRVIKESGPLPYLKMYIVDKDNKVVSKALLGQRLKLIVEIEPSNQYGILAKDCYALNQGNQSNYKLIDENGCSLDPELIKNFRSESNLTKSISAVFSAFKFPVSQSLVFHCKIKLCFHHCTQKICELSNESRKSSPVDLLRMKRYISDDVLGIENMESYPLVVKTFKKPTPAPEKKTRAQESIMIGARSKDFAPLSMGVNRVPNIVAYIMIGILASIGILYS